jgi:histidyl-tRNA synthetase
MPAKSKQKEPIKKAKGMHDILSAGYSLRKKIIEKSEKIAVFYGFKPIQTPHLEKIELFTSSIGEHTDIIEKEMYGLKTKGGDKLVLRPEGTAPIVRAYLEHGMHTKPQPVMFYYHGSFFRHEKPQRGRKREFQQFGLEILGEEDSITDAIVIRVLLAIIEEVAGLKNISVHINSVGCKECRKIYQKELIAYYRKKAKKICDNCNERLRTNTMRLLDCKDEKCSEIKPDAPQIINYICNACTKHFKNLLEILDASNTPYYLDHWLVRGLDYYSRTAFEFFAEDEKSLELGGGGRYDTLAAALGGKDVPGVGGAIGLERLIEKMRKKQKPAQYKKQTKIFFIQLGIEAKHKSLPILEELRKAKMPVAHSLSKDSIKSQLKIASKLQTPYALIFGQKESLEKTIIIRDMKTASQETIPLSRLIECLKKKV